MGTPITSNRWLVAAGLSATVALGACSDSPSSVSSSGLSDVETAELANVIVDDAEAFADASTYDTNHGIRLDVFDLDRGAGPARLFGRQLRSVLTSCNGGRMSPRLVHALQFERTT